MDDDWPPRWFAALAVVGATVWIGVLALVGWAIFRVVTAYT